MQHCQHRSGTDARGDEHDRARVVPKVEITARRGDLDDGSRVGIPVQPTAHDAAVLAFDADPIASARAGQRIAAQRRGIARIGDAQRQVLAWQRDGQRRPVGRFQLDGHHGRAFPVGLHDTKLAKSRPRRFDFDRSVEQVGEGLPPAGAQCRDVDGRAQLRDLAAGQVQQRIDVGDAQFVPAAPRPHDRITRRDVAFGDDTQVEARTVMGDKKIRHLRLAEAHSDAEAGHPWLGDLELGITDAIAIPDADLVVAEAGDREVLPEHAWRKVVAPEVASPVVVRLGLVDHDRAIFSAVAGEIALAIAVDVQPAHHHRVPAPGFCRCRCARSCPAMRRRRACPR